MKLPRKHLFSHEEAPIVKRLLPSRLRRATSLKLAPKKHFVFFGDPKEGGKGVSLPFNF